MSCDYFETIAVRESSISGIDQVAPSAYKRKKLCNSTAAREYMSGLNYTGRHAFGLSVPNLSRVTFCDSQSVIYSGLLLHRIMIIKSNEEIL